MNSTTEHVHALLHSAARSGSVAPTLNQAKEIRQVMLKANLLEMASGAFMFFSDILADAEANSKPKGHKQ